jgi:Holliday junction DNA helicase RuvA
MILDLKDKLGAIDSRWAAATLVEHEAPAIADSSSAWAAAREALTGLGYRDAELDKAWHALKDNLTGEESPDVLIKKALQQLFQG